MTEQEARDLLERFCLPSDPRLDNTVIMGGEHYEWISDHPDEECVRKLSVFRHRLQ